MQGLRLTADLHQCRCAPQWLTDATLLGERCVQAVAHIFHAFPATDQGPGGVTALFEPGHVEHHQLSRGAMAA